jgi:hypothetical protein
VSEFLNIFQADAVGCHIITVTNDILKTLSLVGFGGVLAGYGEDVLQRRGAGIFRRLTEVRSQLASLNGCGLLFATRTGVPLPILIANPTTTPSARELAIQSVRPSTRPDEVINYPVTPSVSGRET